MLASEKKLIVAGLKAGLEHLAVTEQETSWPFPGPVKEIFICYAIGIAQEEGKCSYFAEAAACQHISTMLGWCSTVKEYLQHSLKIDPKLLTVENVQQFRKRWMEHMIAEFS